ncbi:MAG TPA: hypothetical protein VI300_00745 [Solirubrobacter sp.]
MYARPRRDERLGERRSTPAPEPAAHERLLALQRSAGNAAVARALSAAPARTVARTTIDWGGDDLTKLLHIMPWKHGWDELIDAELPMVDEEGVLRSEDKGQLKEAEKDLLKEDYGRAKEFMEIVLREKAGRNRVSTSARGEVWEFRKEFPKEQTRRKVQALTLVIKGFRPIGKGGVLQDRYIVGDAWVETDRQDYLKAHGWNAKGYVAPAPVGVGAEEDT